MTELPCLSTAPLPEIGSVPERGRKQNAWNAPVATTFLFTAEPDRPLRKGNRIPIPGRASFRQGELVLEEQGITVQGAELPPLRDLPVWQRAIFTSRLVIGIGGGSALLRMLAAVGNGASPIDKVVIVGSIVMWIGIGMTQLLLFFYQRQRRPATLQIPWSAVLEVQVHSRLHWAVLICAVTTTVISTGAAQSFTAPVCYLPINGLTPSAMAVLVESVQQHAPYSARCDAAVLDRRALPWLMLAGGAVVVGLIFSLLSLYLWWVGYY